jgi:hypothetical protein
MFRGTSRPANHSRFVFLDPCARDFYPDWERAAKPDVVLTTKASLNWSANCPYAAACSAPVGCAQRAPTLLGDEIVQPPVVGMLELTYQSMELEDDPGLLVGPPGAGKGMQALELSRRLRRTCGRTAASRRSTSRGR